MHRADRLLDAHQRDQPPDLPPAAEMDRVAERPAPVGAERRPACGGGAEPGDEIDRVVHVGGAGEIDRHRGSWRRDLPPGYKLRASARALLVRRAARWSMREIGRAACRGRVCPYV